MMIGSLKDHAVPIGSDSGIAAGHQRPSSGRWN